MRGWLVVIFVVLFALGIGEWGLWAGAVLIWPHLPHPAFTHPSTINVLTILVIAAIIGSTIVALRSRYGSQDYYARLRDDERHR